MNLYQLHQISELITNYFRGEIIKNILKYKIFKDEIWYLLSRIGIIKLNSCHSFLVVEQFSLDLKLRKNTIWFYDCRKVNYELKK